MDDASIDARLKLACFRSITNELSKRNLITPDERRKIDKHLAKMEADLIAANPRKTAPIRKLTTL